MKAMRVNSPVCYECCMQVTYAFPPRFCLSVAPFKRLGRTPMSGRCLLCYFHAYTVWQTFIFGNNSDLVSTCELMMIFLNRSLWKHLCIVVRVRLVEHSLVINENSDRSGIRTHVSGDTAT